jgi:hypothetical protein
MYYRYKSEDNRFSGTDPEELEDALEEQREVFLKHEVEGRKELAIAAQDHDPVEGQARFRTILDGVTITPLSVCRVEAVQHRGPSMHRSVLRELGLWSLGCDCFGY